MEAFDISIRDAALVSDQGLHLQGIVIGLIAFILELTATDMASASSVDSSFEDLY